MSLSLSLVFAGRQMTGRLAGARSLLHEGPPANQRLEAWRSETLANTFRFDRVLVRGFRSKASPDARKEQAVKA